MKIEVTQKSDVEVTVLKIVAEVRYEEEDMPNDFPGRDGDTWTAFIDLASGKIMTADSKAVPTIDLHMKVVDCGSYYLLNADGDQVASIDQNYVPGFMPGDHYGDYLILDIKDGMVTNWSEPDPSEVTSAFFPDED